MQDTDLFQLALGLASPWMVTRSGFDAVDGRLDLYVDFPRGSRFACAQCGREGCAVHDTKEDTWRHLDFFQHRTLLHARTPRVTCPQCGVRKVATPWARAGSGFTLLFEAYVLALAKTMPIANAAERLGEHDTRLWRIVEHYVWRAVEKLDLSRVRRIAADETSARRPPVVADRGRGGRGSALPPLPFSTRQDRPHGWGSRNAQLAARQLRFASAAQGSAWKVRSSDKDAV